jgi:hypothetical protein
LAHRILPQVLTICGPPHSYRCFSLSANCDEKKK